MIEEWLQDLLDRARVAADVRWVLGALAVLSVAIATITIDTATPGGFGRGSIVITLVAVVAAVVPASHTATAVVAIVALQMVGTIDDVTDPRIPVVAICLVLFHTSLALMAVTPHTAPVPAAVIRRWVPRTGVIALATVGSWFLILVLERREATGNATLTVAALAVLVAAVVAVRVRSA